MSAAGKALSRALENPGDWTAGHYEIKHRPSGLAFWVANGPFFFDGSEIEGTPECLGLIERHWLYFKARKVRAKFVKVKRDPAAIVLAAFKAARK